MKYRYEITDPNEIHLLLVNQYQNSSVNIVIRSVIDQIYPDIVYTAALLKLMDKHPYISARFYREHTDEGYRYYGEEIALAEPNLTISNVNDEFVNLTMDSLSDMRTHVFDHDSGELFNFVIYKGESKCLLELTCSHIIGEIPSILILMGDYLSNIDNLISGRNIITNTNKRYSFNEIDFGWQPFKYKSVKIELEKNVRKLGDPWDMPSATLQRHRLPAQTFNEIKSWLENNEIKAKVADVFYYIANQVFTEQLTRKPDLWLILSYRNKTGNTSVNKSIYNFAFFTPVDVTHLEYLPTNLWLESFCNIRDKLITAEGVYENKNLFHSLNKFMENMNHQDGRDILNSIIKFPDFAFNNFGRIDSYIGKFTNFNIIDFDVQDGTPMQEIRYFTLNNEIFINPTFFEKSEVDISEFWQSFSTKLKQLITT